MLSRGTFKSWERPRPVDKLGCVIVRGKIPRCFACGQARLCYYKRKDP